MSTPPVLSNSAKRAALIVVDPQLDFCPGGALAVPGGDAIFPAVNALRAGCCFDAVVLTQDWHPADHASFASNHPGAALFSTIDLGEMGPQVMWPDHCVQGTPGAEFHPALARGDADVVVRKGTLARVDSYSGFGDAFGHKYEKTELEDTLRGLVIEEVVVCGLATDYCVAATAKDAARAGFRVAVVLDASRGIAPDTIAKELEAMAALGIELVDSHAALLQRAGGRVKQ